MSVTRRVQDLDITEIEPEIYARSNEILQSYSLDNVKKSSPAATTFYIWVRLPILSYRRRNIVFLVWDHLWYQYDKPPANVNIIANDHFTYDKPCVLVKNSFTKSIILEFICTKARHSTYENNRQSYTQSLKIVHYGNDNKVMDLVCCSSVTAIIFLNYVSL